MTRDRYGFLGIAELRI